MSMQNQTSERRPSSTSPRDGTVASRNALVEIENTNVPRAGDCYPQDSPKLSNGAVPDLKMDPSQSSGAQGGNQSYAMPENYGRSFDLSSFSFDQYRQYPGSVGFATGAPNEDVTYSLYPNPSQSGQSLSFPVSGSGFQANVSPRLLQQHQRRYQQALSPTQPSPQPLGYQHPPDSLGGILAAEEVSNRRNNHHDARGSFSGMTRPGSSDPPPPSSPNDPMQEVNNGNNTIHVEGNKRPATEKKRVRKGQRRLRQEPTTDPSQHICECCNAPHHSSQAMRRHEIKMAQKFPCPVETCKRAILLPQGDRLPMCFGSKADLERHMRELHGVGLFFCPVARCDRAQRGFPRFSNYVSHCRTQHQIRAPRTAPSASRRASTSLRPSAANFSRPAGASSQFPQMFARAAPRASLSAGNLLGREGHEVVREYLKHLERNVKFDKLEMDLGEKVVSHLGLMGEQVGLMREQVSGVMQMRNQMAARLRDSLQGSRSESQGEEVEDFELPEGLFQGPESLPDEDIG